MFNQIVLIVMLLGLLGCGTMFDGGSSSTKEDKPKSVKLPEKIAFKIPEQIKNTKEEIEEGAVCENKAYQRLKDNVDTFDTRKSETESNLLLAKHIIDDVLERCKNTKIEEKCEVKAGELSYIKGKDLYYVKENKLSPLGKIEFIRYDNQAQFQYSLKIEMNEYIMEDYDDVMIENMEAFQEKTTQFIRWSKDESRIVSKLVFDNIGGKSLFQINYTKMEDNDENMTIYNHFYGEVEEDISTLELIKNSKKEESYKIKSYSKIEGIDEYYEYLVIDNYYGELDIDSGYVSSKSFSSYIDIDPNSLDKSILEYSEEILFGTGGKLLSIESCDSLTESCSLDYCSP